MKELIIPHLDQRPLDRAETIPSAWYTDPKILEFEKETVFPKFWQYGCHDSQIPEPGDIFTFDVAGNQLMLVRDKKHSVRAFYNVCRHRGGPMAVKKGTTSVLQCQYHGWTYLLDGSLRGVPQWNRVDLFDKKDYGLVSVPLEEWQGLYFVNLDDNPQPLNTFLEGISDRISPVDLSKLTFFEEETYLIDCNWKVYVDNFLEGYHIPIVHPELAKLLDYRNYVTETAPWYSLQHSPFQPGDNLYGAENGEAFYYYIFPNIMLNILPGRLQTNVVRPLSADRTEVIFSYYYRDTGSGKAGKIIADDMAYSRKIQEEDVGICEAVQKGLQSKAYDKGRFSVEREEGVYHFQSLLKKAFLKYV